ncbi:hypothetical protein [uncultured Vibrio sp.]|uniref:hypothetical protein n=1 Tax=uncultured Vibrio sp. TaxID=114054 RepID=UPI00262DB3CF|nr:hypothetical protein [uncultured Vibrio sp.]
MAAGCSTSIIKKYARRPNLPVDEETTEPHSDKELEVILARVQPYFYSIAQKISEHFDKYGEIPQRLEGVNIGVSRYEGDLEEKSIDLGSRVDDTHNTSILPFNQMMVSAYLLFCYYTSFNDTQIRDIRHPLRVQTSREAGKTEQYVKVQAFKGRKGSDVKAYFTGIVSGELEEAEATDKTPGYVVANVLKRGKHKHTDGLTFIKTFSEISNQCSHEQYEKLFYSVDSKGNLKKFDLDRLLDQLTFNLGLLAEDRTATSNYLSDVVYRYLNNGVWEKFSVRVDATGFRTVSRELNTQEMKSTRVHSLIYAFVRSLTDIPLKGALIPLVYNDKVKRGLLEVQVKYVDGSTNSFLTPKRYLKTLKKIEERAELFNPLTKRSRGREITRPAYFLPMGVRSETYQWRGHEMPIRRNLLTDIGIPHGAYLLATGSRRLRAKNSDDLYKDADKGKQARDILQHSRKTQNKRYVNGHPKENMRQVSQGLGVLGHIAGGDAVKTAKSKVKDELKITVLAYDEWKQKKMPSNPNGITCNGKIDLKEGKNEHYAAQKFALEKGIISEGEDITCYQYDLCIFCKSLQLIDDAHAVYKLLSFIDSLHDPIEQIPERAEYLIKRVERYESLLDLLPEETLNKADQLFEEHGRYFLFK